MVTGHLREQNGKWQMVMCCTDDLNKKHHAQRSTGLPVRGNKTKANAMLEIAMKNFELEVNKNSFSSLLIKWLMDGTKITDAETFAEYSFHIKNSIKPYFMAGDVKLNEMSSKTIERYLQYEKVKNDVPSNVLRKFYDIIRDVLEYAVALKLIAKNPADGLEPPKDQSRMLFTTMLHDWLDEAHSTVEATTYDSYCSNVNARIIPYFEEHHKDITIYEVTPKMIQDYYKEELKKVTANTVCHRQACIHAAFEYGIRMGFIKENPAAKVKRPKVDKPNTNFYNMAELQQLFQLVKAENEKLILPVILASFYGMRRGEIIGLKWNSIDFGKNTITINHTIDRIRVEGQYAIVGKDRAKSKSSMRTLPLVKPVRDLLLQMWKNQEENKRICAECYNYEFDGYVNVDEMGERLKPGYLTQAFPKLLEKNNLKRIRFHDLRHPYVKLKLKILTGFHCRHIPEKILYFPYYFKPFIGIDLHFVNERIS